MTIQQFDTFEPRLARMNATSKLVKAWESKNAKRAAKASGFTLMAVSLSACGSDDSALDASMADLAAAVASLSAAEAATTAAESQATAAAAAQAAAEADTAAAVAAQAAAEADTGAAQAAQADAEAAQADAEAAQADAEAAQADAEAAQADAEAAQAAAEVDAAAAVDAQAAAEGLQAVAEAAQAVAEADAAAAQAAQAAAEADTATAQAAQAEAEAATAEAEAARDDLQAQVDALLAANTDLAGRTLDVEGETISAGDAADYNIIVAGLTGEADDMTATVTGTGTGELSFTFVDADDSVTLTASDLSSYSSVAITAGTVDLSAVTLGAGVDVTINSGVVMTAAQFLAADSIETDGDGEITVIVNSLTEAEAVLAAAAEKTDGFDMSVTGSNAANIQLENSATSTATDAEVSNVQTSLVTAVVSADVADNPMGLLTERLEDLSDVLAANLESEADADATIKAAENAQFDARVEALGIAEVETIIGKAAAELFINEDAAAPAGSTIDTAVTTAISNNDTSLGNAGVTVNPSDAVTAALISDQQEALATAAASAAEVVEGLEAQFANTLVLQRNDALTEASEAAADASTALNDASADEMGMTGSFNGANAAAGVTAGVIRMDVVTGTAAGDVVDLAITEVSADGVVSVRSTEDIMVDLIAGRTNLNSATENEVRTEAELQAEIDGLFLVDELVAAQNTAAEATAADADATTAVTDASNALAEAIRAADADTDNVFDSDNDVATVNGAQDVLTALDIASTTAGSANTNVADFAELVETRTELLDANADLSGAALDVTEAVNAKATVVTENGLDAADAQAAIINEIDEATTPGIGFEINGDLTDVSAGSAVTNLDNDVVDAALLVGTAGFTNFGTTGLDVVDFGEGYNFVNINDADNTVAQTEVLGDANALEIFYQETSNGIDFYIESNAAEGSTDQAALMDVATISNGTADDITIADITIDVDNGLVSLGEYVPEFV